MSYESESAARTKPKMLTHEEWTMGTPRGILEYHGFKVKGDGYVQFSQFVRGELKPFRTSGDSSWYIAYTRWYEIYDTDLWRALK